MIQGSKTLHDYLCIEINIIKEKYRIKILTIYFLQSLIKSTNKDQLLEVI